MREEVIDKLGQLLEKNVEAEKGYKRVAQKTNNEMLESILLREADKRHEFVVDLADEIIKLGGMPDESESALSKAHRTWIDIKTVLTSDSDRVIVSECRRGDQAAVEEYEQVLRESNLTASSRKVVQQQREEITERFHQWDKLNIE